MKYRINEESLSKEIGKLNLGEIQSEIKAREKHIAILEKNKLINPGILKVYVKSRYQYFLWETLVCKDENKWYFLKMLVVKQINLFDFKVLITNGLGFFIFIIFITIYKFFKYI